jgi:asparagine synthase (glutamine-hydrolysing)
MASHGVRPQILTMCGICGTAGFANRQQLEAMTDAIVHRGPDDGGVEALSRADGTPWIGLGNRRLAIIDLSSAGHMPMSGVDGRVVLTYNGELFNFPELRAKLEARGAVFRSHTDTEVALHAYEAYGLGFLEKLNGMFAIGLWDAREQHLLLARDPFGIKPLYYMPLDGGRLAFASEIKCFLRGGFLQPEIDVEALHYFLNFLWVPGPKTLFKGVYKLMPGHLLLWKEGQYEVKQYWDGRPTAPVRERRTERELISELRDQLRAAVKRHLVSDVPLGVFLSGGLDSSALLAFATEIEQRPMKAYTIAFRDEDAAHEQSGEDRKYARIVAQAFGADHHEIEVQPNIVDLLPLVIWHMDEPVADPAAITSYLICKAAREELTVLLSGQGGDEVFAGYRVHLADRLSAPLRFVPGAVRRGAVQPAWDLLPRLKDKIPGVRPGKVMALHRYGKKVVASADYNRAKRFVCNRSYDALGEQSQLYSKSMRDAVATVDPYETHLRYFHDVSDADFLDQMLYVDQKTFLPELNLTYSDKMSMAVSVEVRVPLLDQELAAFMRPLPARYKIHGMQQKYLFKKAMEGILPDEVIWRGKAGFGAPIRNWLKNDLAPMVDDLLSESSVRNRGFFDPQAIQALVDANATGAGDHAYRLWALLTFELWCRTFIDKKYA